jgi:photosystem II stability/assembly factor-like uncharacterized protein
MKNKLLTLWWLGITAVCFCPWLGLGQTWVQTPAPGETWRSVTCSSNGISLIAVGDEGIYESLDGGLTWLFLNSTPSPSVACSADGTRMIASGSGAVYTSADSGATWQQHLLTPDSQYYVASSADGTRLAAVGYEGNSGSIFLSADSGDTWVTPQEPTNFWVGNIWSAVASSADGTKLIAATEATVGDGSFLPGSIYTSTNSGASWIQTGAPSNVWYSVACSADGTNLIAGAYAGPSQIGGTGLIFTSSDFGNTWTDAGLPTNYWMSVASSADGTHLIAVSLFDQSPDYPGVIWQSTNSGVNWSEDSLTGYFSSAAMSAQGTRLVVTDVAESLIYTYGEPAAAVPAVLPVLSIATVENEISLAWGISNAAGFSLYSSTQLAPPVTWLPVTNLPTLGGNQIQVTLSNSLPGQFFRLGQP